MSMQDPVSDLFTRIRNALHARKQQVVVNKSNFVAALCGLLESEGYISGVAVQGEGAVKHLVLDLKYYQGKPVIQLIKRVSRPGLRIYKQASEIPTVLGGLGEVLVSTSQGVMTGKQAREKSLGGEIVGYVA